MTYLMVKDRGCLDQSSPDLHAIVYMPCHSDQLSIPDAPFIRVQRRIHGFPSDTYYQILARPDIWQWFESHPNLVFNIEGQLVWSTLPGFKSYWQTKITFGSVAQATLFKLTWA